MKLLFILQIESTWFTMYGSIFLVKSIMTLTPPVIARMAQAYFGLHGDVLKNQIDQKTDYICGFFIIIVAFIIQVLISIFSEALNKTFIPVKFILIFVIMTILVSLLFIFIKKMMYNQTHTKATRSYHENELNILIKELMPKSRTKICPEQEHFVVKIAKQYSTFNFDEEELFVVFLKRFTKFFGISFPSNLNLGKYTGKKVKDYTSQ